MKNILVISEGNPRDAKTWSNIPFFLVNELERAGCNVTTVDVGPNVLLRYFFDHFIIHIIRIFDGKNSEFMFNRTKLYNDWCKSRIKKELSRKKNIDCCISTSFSFAPEKSDDYRIVLLCDWTFEYRITHFVGRSPTKLEERAILRQNEVLHNADLVVSLFPDIVSEMRKKYNNVEYLGNVINIENFHENVDIEKKYKSNSVLFIGGKRYIPGLKELIKALKLLRELGETIELNVIGLVGTDIKEEAPDYVHFHGYLRKSIQREKTLL